MAKARGSLQAIAANRLTDGVAVWLGDGPVTDLASWVERVEQALAFDAATVKDALERAKAADKARLVVDLYTIDVAVEGGRTVPLHPRERIKALGPSVRTDLGKQADAAPAVSAPAQAAPAKAA